MAHAEHSTRRTRRRRALKTLSSRALKTVIVGGGRGCRAVLEMVQGDTLGHFRMSILGVADADPEAPGIKFAREHGCENVTSDYRDLLTLEGLDLIIELTGSDEVRDELERTRPRNVRLIDHFGARLFWELHQAEEATIRHRLELQRREQAQRERIAQIFDSIPDEIVVVDKNMIVQHANRSFLTNNRVRIGDVRGCHCYEVEQPVRGECQVAVDNCPFFGVLEDSRSHTVVRKHFDADGNARYAAIVAAPLLDLEGEVTGVIEMTRDITNRILLEEGLKAAEIRLKQFMELAPLATYVKNRHGMYLDVNPATCELLGRQRSEIIGKTDLELLAREAADFFRQGDRDVLQSRHTVSYDGEVELRDRSVCLLVIKYPVIDADGQATAVGCITKDITARKHVEAELLATHQYLQGILDHAPVGVVTTDLDGRVVSCNASIESSLGYTADDLVGQPASILYQTPDEREALLRRLLRGQTIEDHETLLVHKDGSLLPMSVNIGALKDGEGQVIGTVGMSRDISQRKLLMNQIIQSERLAAVGRLAAGVAHEINNPLAVIGEVAGYLGDIFFSEDVDPNELDAELRDGLPKIGAQVRRCRSITSRLLSFARKSEAHEEVADVAAALEEVLPFLEKEARLARVTIHREYDRDLPRVRIEEVQLEEILINLINNAIQAMGAGDRDGNIWIRSAIDDGKVVISVEDDGPGIAEEVRDRIFDPFVSTKPVGQGTGLGLSICYGIVKQYDGELRVHSELGRGATFQVVLRTRRSGEGEATP